MSVSSKLATLEAVVTDVDGVLTDGTVYWSASGEELKRFSFEDIMGLSRGRRAGLALGIISGENSPLVDRFADKLGIKHVAKGCKEKGAELARMAQAMSLDLRNIAYVGDDVNDLPALSIAGIAVAPANAQAPVKAAAQWVLERKGGNGAIRELVEAILAAKGIGH